MIHRCIIIILQALSHYEISVTLLLLHRNDAVKPFSLPMIVMARKVVIALNGRNCSSRRGEQRESKGSREREADKKGSSMLNRIESKWIPEQ